MKVRRTVGLKLKRKYKRYLYDMPNKLLSNAHLSSVATTFEPLFLTINLRGRHLSTRAIEIYPKDYYMKSIKTIRRLKLQYVTLWFTIEKLVG